LAAKEASGRRFAPLKARRSYLVNLVARLSAFSYGSARVGVTFET